METTSGITRKKSAKYIADILMFPLMILTTTSGLIMHTSHQPRGMDMHLPETSMFNWKDVHLISAFLWLILITVHLYQHWAWYKVFFNKLSFKNNKLTLAVSFFGFLLIATGIILFLEILPFEARHSIGGLHNKFGEILTILLIFHIVQRFKWLVKTTKELASGFNNEAAIMNYFLRSNKQNAD